VPLLIVELLGGDDGGLKALALMFPIALPPALLWFGLHLERMRGTGD
jgi:hypothetical protein